MSSIKKYHFESRKVTGCVMPLLYWLCEHTTLMKALHPEHPLGIVKWSIPSSVSKFKSVWLKDLKRKQVVSEVSHISGGRLNEELEEKHIIHDTLPSGDVKVAKVSNTAYSYDGLRYEESMKILSLIAEGDQLWDEYAETLTHAVTQSVKADPKDEEQRGKEKKRN